MASRNATYDNHEAVVDLWIARRRERQNSTPRAKVQEEKVRYGNYDPDEAMKVALQRTLDYAVEQSAS